VVVVAVVDKEGEGEVSWESADGDGLVESGAWLGVEALGGRWRLVNYVFRGGDPFELAALTSRSCALLGRRLHHRRSPRQ
jgi:hypothetical protein